MRRDFEKFVIAQQKQMNEMNKILEKVNKELTEGLCTQEQRDSFQKYYDTMKSNYDRLAYVRHLLMLPPEFIQRIQHTVSRYKMELDKYKQLKADKDSVLEENAAAIQGMKDTLGSEGE